MRSFPPLGLLRVLRPTPAGLGSATGLPTTGLVVRWEGDRGMVPTFTSKPFVQGGAQLYPGSLATVTPQTFAVASCPTTTNQTRSLTPILVKKMTVCALQTGPYPPGLSRYEPYGISATGSLSLHLLNSLDGPASSGRADTSRRCRGCFPPFPAFPGTGCPQLHQVAATTCWRSRFTSTWSRGASWRT